MDIFYLLLILSSFGPALILGLLLIGLRTIFFVFFLLLTILTIVALIVVAAVTVISIAAVVFVVGRFIPMFVVIALLIESAY